MKELLTPKEVAELLQVSENTLAWWRWAKQELPFIKIKNRRVRYRRGDVEAWLSRNFQKVGEEGE